jgi:hypothetical protein
MGRKAHANYEEAALAVLQELGGGPINTKTLVAAAQDKGLIGEGKWVYHNFSRKIRESELFDTSLRGQVSLAPAIKGLEPCVEEPEGEFEVEVEVSEAGAQDLAEQNFPGPVLGEEV